MCHTATTEIPSFVFGPVTVLDAIQSIFRREGCKRAVRVVERILEIPDDLRLGSRRIVPAFFAIVGRLVPLELVEEGELRAGHMLHLLAEGARVVELSDRGYEAILLLRHRLRYTEKIPLGELQREADTFGDGFGNIMLLLASFRSSLLCQTRPGMCKQPEA